MPTTIDIISLVILPLCALLTLIWAVPALLLGATGVVASLVLQFTCCCCVRADPLKGKVILITGGSSGIGLAIAKLAARRGAQLIVAARNRERLAAARDEILGACGTASDARLPDEIISTISVDVTEPFEKVEAALRAEPLVASGRVDYAILSAGDSGPAAFEDIAPAAWERLLRLNVLGCVWAARTVLPGMKARRTGRIVFVSSLAGAAGVYGYTAYSASKFALRGLAEALRMEVRPHGVGVSLVLPPDVDTPLLARENVGKPVECKRISAGAGVLSADALAAATLDGMRRGKSVITCGLDGWMLGHLTCGMYPPDAPSALLSGLFLWPLLRLVAIAHTYYYDRICSEEARKRDGAAGDAYVAAGP